MRIIRPTKNFTASFSFFCGLILMDPILYPQRRHLDHGTPWGLEYPEFFLTICCQPRGLNQLCHPGVGDRVLEAAHHYHVSGKWYCELMILMPDHLHAFITPGTGTSLKRVVRSFKSWTAKDTGVIWQTGFFDHRLRDGSSAAQKWKYVNENPVRAGLVPTPEQWPWRFVGRAGRPRPADGNFNIQDPTIPSADEDHRPYRITSAERSSGRFRGRRIR